MEKSKYVRVVEGEKVRRDDPIQHFPWGQKYLLSPRGGDGNWSPPE